MGESNNERENKEDTTVFRCQYVLLVTRSACTSIRNHLIFKLSYKSLGRIFSNILPAVQIIWDEYNIDV